nr:immunoglobulin heavy chain junction region [Mus musculus]
CTRILRW